MEWQDIVIRLGLSMLAGLLIGMEREHNRRPAGIKTHILVCMGAALISLIQLEIVHMAEQTVLQFPELANSVKSDYGRMGAQVVSGIGFLGAGTIMHTRGSVKGLTTAATLWMVAGVGLAIGMGYILMSAIAVAFVLLMLIGLKLLQRLLRNRTGEKSIEIHFTHKKTTMQRICDYFSENRIEIENIEITDTTADKKNDRLIYNCTYTVVLPRCMDLQAVVSDISCEENVVSVHESV